jgi:hypothetical protein
MDRILNLRFGIQEVEDRGRGKAAIETDPHARLGKRGPHQRDQTPQHGCAPCVAASVGSMSMVIRQLVIDLAGLARVRQTGAHLFDQTRLPVVALVDRRKQHRSAIAGATGLVEQQRHGTFLNFREQNTLCGGKISQTKALSVL